MKFILIAILLAKYGAGAYYLCTRNTPSGRAWRLGRCRAFLAELAPQAEDLGRRLAEAEAAEELPDGVEDDEYEAMLGRMRADHARLGDRVRCLQLEIGALEGSTLPHPHLDH